MARAVPLILAVAVSHATVFQAQFLGCRLIDQITLEDCKVLEKLVSVRKLNLSSHGQYEMGTITPKQCTRN